MRSNWTWNLRFRVEQVTEAKRRIKNRTQYLLLVSLQMFGVPSPVRTVVFLRAVLNHINGARTRANLQCHAQPRLAAPRPRRRSRVPGCPSRCRAQLRPLEPSPAQGSPLPLGVNPTRSAGDGPRRLHPTLPPTSNPRPVSPWTFRVPELRHLGERIHNKLVGDRIVVVGSNRFSVDLVADVLRWGRHWGRQLGYERKQSPGRE
jgi:hypothetical protein